MTEIPVVLMSDAEKVARYEEVLGWVLNFPRTLDTAVRERVRIALEGDETPLMVKCPGCDHWLPEHDSGAQMEHMQASHPEIIQARLQEAGIFERPERPGDFGEHM